VLDILQHKRITLIGPETWEDRNDAYYMNRYRQEKGLKTLVAICFAERSERFHHWKVFSPGSSGICLEFDKKKLLSAFTSTKGVRTSAMRYLWIKDVTAKRPPISEWPFLKRKVYVDECEFRIVYQDTTTAALTKSFPIDLSSIRKITLSPWLHEAVAESVRETIQMIPGCEHFKANRSSLIENTSWKSAIK
jgi:hypothetical protein